MDKRICSVEGCDRATHTRGWCQKHYTRWQRHGDPEMVKQIVGDDPARLFEKVRKTPSGCWEWQGVRGTTGYGGFHMGRRTWLAHRAAYVLFVGPIPAMMTIDHLCVNRACVNPAHLEPVSQRENLVRGISRRSDPLRTGS